MDYAFLTARIEKTQEQIVAYEDAIDALILKKAKSYTLNTGQTIQIVTRQDLKDLQETLDKLLNRLATYQARRDGASTIVRPAW